MKTVLIVEDDALISKALEVRLQSEGFGVVTAADGLEGIMSAIAEIPNLILMDISLPIGDGLSAAERIQRIIGLGDTPVIFMTTSKEPALRTQAEKLGAAGLLREALRLRKDRRRCQESAGRRRERVRA